MDTSEQNPSGERNRYNYVTTILLPARIGTSVPERVIMGHDSLAAVANYLEFNGYVIGTPRPGMAYASIETHDGKQLSDEELDYLAEKGASRAHYARKVLGASTGRGYDDVPDGVMGDPDKIFLPELDVVPDRSDLSHLDGNVGDHVLKIAIEYNSWLGKGDKTNG